MNSTQADWAQKNRQSLTAGRFLEVSSGFEPLYKLLQSLA